MALSSITENLHEDEEDLIHIEFHMRNTYADEHGSIFFEVKVLGQDPFCTWYNNGKVIPYNPRYNVSKHGLWHRLNIKNVKKCDAGIYTVVCRNDFSYAESQATLTVSTKRPVDFAYRRPQSILYLPWPKSNIKIKKHLRNLRVIPGESISLRVEISKSRFVCPDFTWYRNNRLCAFEDAAQLVGNDHDFAEYVKYNASVKDSGLYTVLVYYYDILISSSAEVIVLDPNEENPPVANNGSPSFYSYLPEELEVFEKEEIRLVCKANIDPDTSVHWMKNLEQIYANDNIVIENLENKGVALKVLECDTQDTGAYTLIVRNKITGSEISSQCFVNVSRPPLLEIPEATVHHPLKVVITSIGTAVCLYCKFKFSKKDLFFAVWRVGLFRIERCSSQFRVISNQTGMFALYIRNVDPDMLGEVSCELRYMLQSKRSIPVAITKGFLIHAPLGAMAEESYGEYKLWIEKLNAEMEMEKSTVLYSATELQLPSGPVYSNDDRSREEARQDEAAAYPLEVSGGGSGTRSNNSLLQDSDSTVSDNDTLVDLSSISDSSTLGSPRGITVRCAQLVDNVEEELMEMVYCRLTDDSRHLLLIHSCQHRKMLVIAESQYEDEDRTLPQEFINVVWINKRGLPPGTLYAIDSYQPSGAYYRCGVTSDPVLIISAANAHNLMLFRIRIIRTYEKTPQATFIVCPPRPNVLKPLILQRHPTEEFAKKYTIIGDPMGTGAFGAVYLVKDKNDDFYAAKVVKTRTEKRREATRREIEIMEFLQHRRIVQLHAVYLSRDQSIFVMESLWGGELFERIVEEDNFKERTAVHYVHQICEGLEYLHRQKIVHLDIKPENVICISRNSRDIKIVDFGLSRVLEKGVIRAIYGSRDYIAPEVLSFEAIRTASDMWSLGVVTYVMLSGTVPFVGANWAEHAANITKGAYNFDDPAFDTVTAEAKEFINALLVLDPEDRLTAVTARQHPWMLDGPKHEVGLGQTKRWRSNLKTYLETNKDRWQRAGNVVIAANRLLIGAHRESKPRPSDV